MRRVFTVVLSLLLVCGMAFAAQATGGGQMVSLAFHGSNLLASMHGTFGATQIGVTVTDGNFSGGVELVLQIIIDTEVHETSVRRDGVHQITLPADFVNSIKPGSYPISVQNVPNANNQTVSIGEVGVFTVYKHIPAISGNLNAEGIMGEVGGYAVDLTLSDAYATDADPMPFTLTLQGAGVSVSGSATKNGGLAFTLSASALNALPIGFYPLMLDSPGNAYTEPITQQVGMLTVREPQMEVGDIYGEPEVSEPEEEEEEEEVLELSNGVKWTLEELKELPRVDGMLLLGVPSASPGGNSLIIPTSMLKELPAPLLIETSYCRYVLPNNPNAILSEFAGTLRGKRFTINEVYLSVSISKMELTEEMQNSLKLLLGDSTEFFTPVEFVIKALAPTGRELLTVTRFASPIMRYLPIDEELAAQPTKWAAFRYNPLTQELRPTYQRIVKMDDGSTMVGISSYTNSVYLLTRRDITISDVEADHPAYPYIEMATVKALMDTTDDQFKPDESVSRGEFVQLFTNILYLPEMSPPHPYTDVLSDNPYDFAISQSHAAGWLDLLAPEGEFHSEQYITREETLGILHAILVQNNAEGDAAAADTLTRKYSDYWDIAPEYMNALSIIEPMGLLPETEEGGLDPMGEVTRAQAAEILIKTLVTVGYLDE